VYPRAGLDDLEKRKFLPPPGLELRSLGRPARRKSLYRLRYPGSYIGEIASKIIYHRSLFMYRIKSDVPTKLNIVLMPS
jgi:hypothetical protein